MSSEHPPPGHYGGQEDQPPPYGKQYGQPYGGGQQGQPGAQPPGQGYPPPQQPQTGWGQPAGQWGQQPQGSWDYGAHGDYGVYQESKRPGTVLGGAIMTYIGAGLMIIFGLLVVFGSAAGDVLANNPQVANNPQLAETPLDALRTIFVVAGIVSAVIGILLIALAVVAQRGRSGGRIGLSIIGVIMMLLSLYAAVSGAYANIVVVVYIAAAVALFWVGGANNWYRARKAAR